jgi:hypothetical protein
VVRFGHHGTNLNIPPGLALPAQIDDVGRGVSDNFITFDKGVGDIGVGPVTLLIPLFKRQVESLNGKVNEAFS